MTTRLTEVVIDSADPAAAGSWWAAALGWVVTQEDPDEVVVQPPDEADRMLVPGLLFGSVPEPKTVKNRVHFDLTSDSPEHQQAVVARLIEAGAVPVDIGQVGVPWVVLADPEGNELCVLEPRDQYLGRGPFASIVLDAADPVALAPFWAAATGWTLDTPVPGAISLHNPSGRLPDIDLVTVSDPKVVKNRVHLDVAPLPEDDHSAEVERLLAAGATRADVGQGAEVTWVVLADPEGNELCVLSPR